MSPTDAHRDRPRVLLVNDTGNQSSHFGCQLVNQAIREQLARVGLRLVGSVSKKVTPDEIGQLGEHFDLALVNGEGTVHHGRGANLVEIGRLVPAVFVNAVYEQNEGLPPLSAFRYVAMRESQSAAYVRQSGVDCAVVPDVIFASGLLTGYAALLRARKARGLFAPEGGTAVTDSAVRKSRRLGPFRIRSAEGDMTSFVAKPVDYLNYLADHKAVWAGRFHAACAAAVLGLPFTSWDSNTWKIRGLAADMGASSFHFATREEALRHAPPHAPLESVEAYVAGAGARIERMFDIIAAIARDVAR